MLPSLALAMALAAAPSDPGAPPTLRLDYFHTASASEERFALDGLVLEGPWPGNPDRPIDDTNLGKYLFEVIDRATNRVVYSRGFASICGEWETTDEAKGTPPHLPRVAALPGAEGPGAGRPQEARRRRASSARPGRCPWTRRTRASTAPARPRARSWAVVENGPPRDKVDLLLLGDGYTAAEMGKWHADAKRLADILFSVSPFKERKADFNVWAVDTPSDESGVARPSDGVHRRSALRAAYDAFGSERYVLAFDNKRVREAAAAAPYDVMEIVVNGRKYGGGGIFNLYATVASDNAFTPYVFVHEFGHHFAGLADEYYTSDVAYGSVAERPEPWELNVTAHPGLAQVEGPRDRGDAAPDAVGEGGVRGGAEGDPGAAPADPGGEAARGGDGGPLPRGAAEGGRAPGAGSPRGRGGRLRGRDVRGEGVLPRPGELHHVHPPHGVLPGLRSGAREGDRPLRPPGPVGPAPPGVIMGPA